MERPESEKQADALVVTTRKTVHAGRSLGRADISISFKPNGSEPPPDPQRLLTEIQSIESLSPRRRKLKGGKSARQY